MKRALIIFGLLILTGVTPALAAFTEPIMSDYQATPIFTEESVTPNIMVILDNSGSMNEPAYRESFKGVPYFSGEYPVVSWDDDMEGSGAPDTSPDNQLWDLDMGEQVVGLRFQDIQIEQGATITNAYIEFVSCDGSDTITTNLAIGVEDNDNALAFSASNPITSRTVTSEVPWNGVPTYGSGVHYNSPDLTSLVQAVVDRSGWVRGNAMVFRITGSGERDVYPYDNQSNNPNLAPKLVIVTDTHGKRYYGLFNPDCFYEYSGGIFVPVFQKESFDYGSNSWTGYAFNSSTKTLAATISTLTATQIDAQYWDGNFLNWATMRRVDVLRKVLVGGLSDTRGSGGDQTVEGEDPRDSYDHYRNWDWYGHRQHLDTTNAMPVCPYHGDYDYYANQYGNLVVNGTSYNIEVQKEPVLEPQDFDDDGDLVGVLQRIGDKARWGNTWYQQRQLGRRTAVTVIHSPSTVPPWPYHDGFRPVRSNAAQPARRWLKPCMWSCNTSNRRLWPAVWGTPTTVLPSPDGQVAA